MIAEDDARQSEASARPSIVAAIIFLLLWTSDTVTAVAHAQKPPASSADPQAARSAAGMWGDQHDGTFLNPILPGDFSDLDAIRVGGDFYAISSTMQYSPGMAVLHSTDLVNWEIVGHVVRDLGALDPELGWERMNREGRGIWAGSIRFHGGFFWVYFGTPDGGIYVASARHPEGPWSSPRAVIAAAGWDDPCPFWDDDGKGYLVATRFSDDGAGQAYQIHLFSMNTNNDGIVEGSDYILHQSEGSEANKLYKVKDFYLHYFSEVRPEGRVAMMERSTSLHGPWATRQLNHVHGAVDKEPNQGGLIRLKDGHWWFLSHQGRGDWEGRAGVLLPVNWTDAWPVLGRPGQDGIGEMVWGGIKPQLPQSKSALFASDSLRERSLRPEWEWRYQPKPNAWSLTGDGLRLQALLPLTKKEDFKGFRDVLTQRAARSTRAEVTVKVGLQGFADGEESGLAHFADEACRLAVVQKATGQRLLRSVPGAAMDIPLADAKNVWLRSTWGVAGLARFSYSLDGTTFRDTRESCQLSWGSYRGDRIGLYSVNAIREQGFADFSDFSYEVR